MTRRHLLATAAGALTANAAAPPQIIDTHIHLYDPTRPQGVPWPPKTDPLLYQPTLPQRYAALVRPLGVTRAIVVEASAWVEDNQWILDLAKNHPIIAGLVGHLTPATPDFRQHLARFARNPLFKGIRLNGAALTAATVPFLDDLKRLAEAGLMLDAIGNATMLPSLQRIAAKLPTLRIAIDHMPTEPPGWTESRAIMRDLAVSPQVYAKVSGVLKSPSEDLARYRDILDEVWTMFGPDRVMYGSNWPVSERIAPYASVLGVMKKYLATKDAASAEKYFWRNSQSCYRWTAN